jgi:hypothetical protein
MSNGGGRLGALECTTTTWKTLYKPATGMTAAVVVSFCNRKNATRTVRLGCIQNATADQPPADGEMLIYDTVLQAAGDAFDRDKLSMSGIVLNGSNNDQLVVYASGDDVDCQVHGVTES